MNLKTRQLDDLFLEWEKNCVNRWMIKNQEKDKDRPAIRFIRDGIIRERCFLSKREKVLFLAKEVNSGLNSEDDFRSFLEEGPKYLFSHRISEWAWGILNGFPSWRDDIGGEEKKDAIHSVAIMNLKKVAGGPSSDREGILSSVKEDLYFIRKEIEIIQPTIIIGCIGFDVEIWRIVFPGIKFCRVLGIGVGSCMINGTKVKTIDFYHPSYRVPKSMSYALLKFVFSSDEFGSL